jgi:signal transduction histidine kinase/DNA-binding response OmpR family regulator
LDLIDRTTTLTSPLSRPSTLTTLRSRGMFTLPLGTFSGFVVAGLAALVIGLASWQSLEDRAVAADRVSRSLELIAEAQQTLSTLRDAETGQRGFLLTGTEQYLEPYTAARERLSSNLLRLRELAGSSPRERERLDALENAAGEKMDELNKTVQLRREGKTEEALAIVRSDQGKLAMDRIRASIATLVREQDSELSAAQTEWQDTVRNSALINVIGSITLLTLIAVAAAIASRDYRAQKRQEWIREGQVGLAQAIAAEDRLDVQADATLAFLADYVRAQVGALYVSDETGTLRRVAGYALGKDTGQTSLVLGANLLAQAAKSNKPIRVSDVPEGYLSVVSATGTAPAREVLIAPATIEGVAHGAVELGFLRTVASAEGDLLERVGEMLGAAIRTAKDRQRVVELLEETQEQAEELQAQQEELRVSNEELEEQGRVLKESQATLESQQAELEQTNAQLSSQSEMLELQNSSLVQAQTALDERAAELERSNRIKSEFLANMSHELRTPLNSTLILAKLLADNKDGNLDAEQIKFAETISSASKDLLALINDILDLSKLEAGKVEVAAENVSLARVVDGLRKTFAPMAEQKKLDFRAETAPDLPASLFTDEQRLGQILRNLLANAIKFTERGEVVLRVDAPDERQIRFSVRDTGVGISAEHHSLVFEAFQQADGSTHRKYGGTGLGLSISRDLARLLGGAISLESAVGLGSTFTLTLPRQFTGSLGKGDGGTSIEPPAAGRGSVTASLPMPSVPSLSPLPPAHGGTTSGTQGVDDDRLQLRSDARLILVIEDDPRFASILRDLAHDLDFQCIVAPTAGEGLAAAATYLPSAILLDMNLPDYSGLSVLDQLKRNPQTRHIPVHVASVVDYSREALERGAIGYALKPVKRDELVDALKGLEAKLMQRLRQVLVVEDDARQLESITRLLEHEDVRIVGVASATDALARLRDTTFDCMVMDLNLPDLSGYDLLEQMAEQDGVSFPPVIVYTGRSLSRDE